MKAKSFFWFSTSNPGIENAGFIGESKRKILDKISAEYLPNYVFVAANSSLEDALVQIRNQSMSYPLIAKPDVGERGQAVSKIEDLFELKAYHQKMKVSYLIQEYIDFELELGVFYYRMPNSDKGKITSIVQKSFLKITGDGSKSLGELIENYPRARFRIDYLKIKFKKRWEEVIALGIEIELENIGNHVRGTTFLNANHLINPKLEAVFDQIAKPIDGFYYGRFDLRCKSVADLNRGQNIKILELNGSGAEPAHIYEPGFSFWAAQAVLLKHWKIMYQISMQNHTNGHRFMTYREAKLEFSKHRVAIAHLKGI